MANVAKLPINRPVTLQIDKSVALPEQVFGRRALGPVQMTLEALEPGESFFTDLRQPSAQTAIATFRKRHKEHTFKFTCRTVTESGRKGTRIWRTA